MIRSTSTSTRPLYNWFSAYLDLYQFLPSTPDTPFERVLYFNEDNSNAYTLKQLPGDYTRYYRIGPQSTIQQLNIYTYPALIDAGLDIDNIQILYTNKYEQETLEEFIPVVDVLAGTGYASLVWTIDQVTWNRIDDLTLFSNANDVAFNGTLWVATGDGANHTLAYSENGKVWVGLGKSVFSVRGNRVSWNGQMWVAAGKGSVHTLAYSVDGKTWTGLGKTIFDTEALSVSWGLTNNTGRWIATGLRDVTYNNTLAYSTNGTTWTGLGSSIFTDFASQAYSNGTYWVACGKGSNTLATSNNGTTWVGRGQTVFSVAGRGVSWSDTLQQWIAVGEGATNTLAYSTDLQGITWIGLGKTIFTTTGYGARWSGTRWLAVGSGGNTVASSLYGKEWVGLGTDIFSINGKGVGTSNVPVDRLTSSVETTSLHNMRTTLTNLALPSASWNGYTAQGSTRPWPFVNGGPGYVAFDGDLSSFWYSPETYDSDTGKRTLNASQSYFNIDSGPIYGEWIQLGFPQLQRINRVKIYPYSTSDAEARSRSPRDWLVGGSNNSSGPWVLVAQFTDIRNWEAGYTQEFHFQNEIPYQYYRIVITRIGNFDNIQTYGEGIPQNRAQIANIDFFYEQPGTAVNTLNMKPEDNFNVALPINGYYAYANEELLIPATVDIDWKDQVLYLPTTPSATKTESSLVALYIKGRTGKSGLRQSCAVHIQGKIFR